MTRTSQPQSPVAFNFGHPLARGFASPNARFYTFAPAWGALDAINRMRATLNGTVSYGVDAYRGGNGNPRNWSCYGVSGGSDANYLDTGLSVTNCDGQGTIYWSQNPATVSSEWVSWGAYDSSPDTGLYAYNNSGSSVFRVGWTHTSTDGRVAPAISAAEAVGRLDQYALTWAAGQKPLLYINGALNATTPPSAYAGGASWFSNVTIAIGRCGALNGFAYTGNIHYWARSTAAHSAAEVAAFHANPWQIFAPLSARSYSFPTVIALQQDPGAGWGNKGKGKKKYGDDLSYEDWSKFVEFRERLVEIKAERAPAKLVQEVKRAAAPIVQRLEIPREIWTPPKLDATAAQLAAGIQRMLDYMAQIDAMTAAALEAYRREQEDDELAASILLLH